MELERTRPIRISGQQRLLIGRSSTLTITVPCNVPEAIPLDITTNPAGRVFHPTRVMVPGHFTSVTLDIAAGVNAPEGDVTLRVSDPSGEHDDGEIIITVRRPVTALALSGGGAKGSFEVGAFAYLAQRWAELNVKAVCGVSVGAINALAVAENTGLPAALKMQDIWLQLRKKEDMYGEQWWAAIAKARIANALPGSPAELYAMNLADLIFPPDPDDGLCGKGRRVVITGGWEGWDDVWDVVKWALPVVAIADELGLFGWVEERVITYVAGEILLDVMEIGKGVISFLDNQPTQSLFHLKPVRTRLEEALDARLLEEVLDPKQPAAPQLALRLGAIDVESGELVWITGRGDVVIGRNAAGPVRQTPARLPGRRPTLKDKLIDGALASAAMPGIFPAVEIEEANGTRHLCIDGGLRDVLPARAALDLGADTVIAIATGPGGMERVEVTNPLEVVARSLMEIEGNEIGYGDRTDYLTYGPDVRQILIEPSFPVHATTQIDPGLLRINIAYGYMRAFDELYIAERGLASDPADHLRESTDSIIRLRREIWRLENRSFCFIFADLERRKVEDIRVKKRYLVALLDMRVTNWGIASLPRRLGTQGQPWSETLEDWWLEWEQHQDHIRPREPTPWDRHQFRTYEGAPFREPPPTRPVVPPTLQAAL